LADAVTSMPLLPMPDPLPPFISRKPQRISVTVSWALFQSMDEISTAEGRSLSNMAAHWLERHAEAIRKGAG